MLQEQTSLPNGAIIQDRHGERYTVEGLLGQGGFSAVYRVRDRRTKQKIFAIKEVIDPNQQERRNLAFEAELLMRLKHRSLPNVYQVFENVRLNRIYMLMDFIDGKNLETLRREQPEQRFSLPLALTLMTPIVEAVSYLHAQPQPIVHRDIKPANIIVPTGASDALLVDFGLAKEYVENKTTSVFRYGTPGYAAPEQYGQGTNPRTDVYALGATLYTLITGSVPTDALTRSVNQQDGDLFKRVDELCPGISSVVADIIDRSMSLRHENRFASVEEFWQALCIAATMQQVNATVAVGQPDIALPRTPAFTKAVPTKRDKTRKKVTRKQKALFFVILGILLAAAAFDGVFVIVLNMHTSSARSGQKGHTRASTVVPTASIDATTAPAYPQLEVSYAGPIQDLGVTVTNGDMYLTNIKQKLDVVSGTFKGLGLAGPFDGTVTADSIKFTVYPEGLPQKEAMHFRARFNLGYLADGDFTSFYMDGTRTGDYGNWSASPWSQATPTSATTRK